MKRIDSAAYRIQFQDYLKECLENQMLAVCCTSNTFRLPKDFYIDLVRKCDIEATQRLIFDKAHEKFKLKATLDCYGRYIIKRSEAKRILGVSFSFATGIRASILLEMEAWGLIKILDKQNILVR